MEYDIMANLVLLDRDGTINEDEDLICKTSQVRLIPRAAQAIKLLNERSITVAMVTNQPVVARNLCTEDDVRKINKHIVSMLAKQGARIDAVYYCPHHPEKGHPGANPIYRVDCDCRKPKIGMLKAASERFGIAPKDCFMIGDTTRDIKAGKDFGCKTILVRTGHGGKDKKYDVTADHVCDDLYDAAKLVVSLI